MSAEELSSKAQSYIKTKKTDDAIPFISELITRYPDHAKIGKYKILLAELQFKAKNYAGAKELYEHFSEYFPSDKHAEYARYKSILSAFYQTLPADCDQSYTDQTVKLCKDYLAQTQLKKYRTDVEKILAKNQERLAEKEMYIFDFYLGKKQFDAARARLAYLKDHYATLPNIAPRLAFLSYKLALKEKKQDEALIQLNELQQHFPESNYVQMAQNLNTKSTFIF